MSGRSGGSALVWVEEPGSRFYLVFRVGDGCELWVARRFGLSATALASQGRVPGLRRGRGGKRQISSSRLQAADK